jgi:hypothetical protein
VLFAKLDVPPEAMSVLENRYKDTKMSKSGTEITIINRQVPKNGITGGF